MTRPSPLFSPPVLSSPPALSSPSAGAAAFTAGPLGARNPDLEVLLTDGLGGFALSSLAGVPTRCYSGLVVSHQPPVRRRTHFVSPLEVLEQGPREATLHALEIAPGVFEGRGLELLSGASLRDLLPEREQQVWGVQVRRQSFSPRGSGAVVFLYDVHSPEPVTLRLGGYFVDRDMHATHQRAPDLEFSAPRSGRTGEQTVTVRGETETQVTLHAAGHATGDAGATITALTGAAFPQRVYYRHDEARGEPDHEVTLGRALWTVTFPAGGGRAALIIQGTVQANAPEVACAVAGEAAAEVPRTAEARTPDGSVPHTSIPDTSVPDTWPPEPWAADPWEALAQEAARRRELAVRAQVTCGVHDPLVATLAVAADAYLVRRLHPRGVSVIAGYPWFADWGRDAMIALSGLTLLTGRHAEARDVLSTFLASLRRGLAPNNFHDDGAGAGYNTVDGALWLAVSLERYVAASGDLDFARLALPQLRELLDWHVRGTDHGVRVDPADGLLLAGQSGVQLTWMDVKIEDWVVTPRHGKPVEVQGLWLAALGAEARLSAALGQESRLVALRSQAAASFGAFWTAQGYADTLDETGADLSVRPNVALALALPDTPGGPGVPAAVRRIQSELLTPLGLHTLSPLDARYRGNYGGPQVQRDAAYHQGTVWPWPLTAFVELLLAQGDVRGARAALGGLSGHVWEAGLGHVSEVFSGDTLRPGGCPFQAWSVAELLRAHVLVSRAEAQAAATPGGLDAGTGGSGAQP